jgi:putative flippase GtrA
MSSNPSKSARPFLRPNFGRAAFVGRGSILRNSLAGFIATGADFGAVTALVATQWLSVPTATLFGCIVGGVANFMINRLWAFGSNLAYLRQAWRYAMVSGSSALFNAGLVALLLVFWRGPYQLAWLAARGIVYFCWNYPMHRFYVFVHAPVAAARDKG